MNVLHETKSDKFGFSAPKRSSVEIMGRKTVAVIVTFNRLDQLKQTLAHTLAEPFYRVVVINNASTDGTKAWLDGVRDDKLVVIHTETNLGGAGGFHIGFEHAAREITEAEWLVAFDDDAYPQAGTLAAFDRLDIPAQVGSLAAAVYLPDGRISEMNRPSLNPFWHLKQLLFTSFRGRSGFHVEDSDYQADQPLKIDGSSFVGYFLRLSLIREKRVGLPRTEIFIYADDIIFILGLRKKGYEHWFVPDLKFSHDCKTLMDQRDLYYPLWRVYYIFRNRIEMYRVASGIFFPFVLMVKIPKFFLDVRHYKPEERRHFLTIAARSIWHGLTQNFSMKFDDVIRFCELPRGYSQ